MNLERIKHLVHAHGRFMQLTDEHYRCIAEATLQAEEEEAAKEYDDPEERELADRNEGDEPETAQETAARIEARRFNPGPHAQGVISKVETLAEAAETQRILEQAAPITPDALAGLDQDPPAATGEQAPAPVEAPAATGVPAVPPVAGAEPVAPELVPNQAAPAEGQALEQKPAAEPVSPADAAAPQNGGAVG